MASGFHIVPVASDNDAYLDIMAAIHRAAFENQSDEIWSAQSMQAMISQPNFHGFVAINENKPIGMAILSAVIDEVEIITIAVAPDHQGSGLGRAFLVYLEQYFCELGCLRMFLDVRQDNLPAKHLYKTAGFNLIAQRKGYYKSKSGQSVAAEVFSKEITNN